MSHRTLEMGIAAVQRNSPAEGARLIRIALKSGELAPDVRAIAYLWLAETQTDPQQKRALYGEALAADPNNAEARQRLATLLTAQLPAAPALATQTQQVAVAGGQASAQPVGVNIADHVAHVIGGPNGASTAFFVSAGVLATTRHVVGGLQQMTCELHDGRQLTGYVVRAFTDLDLTLIRIEHDPGSLLPITPLPRVPDNAPLTIVTYEGEMSAARSDRLSASWRRTGFRRPPPA